MDSTELLEQGRRAFDRRAWTEAYEHLTAAARAAPLEPGDLERVATSAYLSGRDGDSTDAWTRAHQAWLDRGEPEAVPAHRAQLRALHGPVRPRPRAVAGADG